MNLLHKGWFTEFSPDDRKKLESQRDGNEDMTSSNSSSSSYDDTENDTMWPGQSFSLQVKEVLLDKQSDFQHVVVVKTKSYGNCLILDNIIQCTERDEFTYQEMMAHLPLFAHPNPKKVLVVGGGDGGCAREVLKHPSVESVTLCEIDNVVIEAAKRFLPKMASSFKHPKMHVHVGDGLKFMGEHKNEFDVIITDSSDPIGPAEGLFGKKFYELLYAALTDDGVIACQGESIWLHLHMIQVVQKYTREFFPHCAFASVTVPTYPTGNIGVVVASKTKAANFNARKPLRRITTEQINDWKLKYYSAAVHEAAFVLPNFAADALGQHS